jgi:hypothetical protein
MTFPIERNRWKPHAAKSRLYCRWDITVQRRFWVVLLFADCSAFLRFRATEGNVSFRSWWTRFMRFCNRWGGGGGNDLHLWTDSSSFSHNIYRNHTSCPRMHLSSLSLLREASWSSLYVMKCVMSFRFWLKAVNRCPISVIPFRLTSSQKLGGKALALRLSSGVRCRGTKLERVGYIRSWIISFKLSSAAAISPCTRHADPSE